MKKALLILATALTLLMTSCAETFSPSISITPSKAYVPYTGGSVDITVMTTLPWKAEATDGSGAVLSEQNGIGEDVVTITIPATDNWTTSCVTVKFYSRSNSSTATKTAYITQGYKPYISVEGESGTIAKEGGVVRLVVTANAAWTASCSTPGVTVTPGNGPVGNEAVLVTVPANSGATRKITVNFAIDGDSDSFEFYQN
ncbi:MAG: BACON domain-containing protein [Bacteroidales bacterium]|nr:BACON domain-containing protein [Bacteroidales bacterium]